MWMGAHLDLPWLTRGWNLPPGPVALWASPQVQPGCGPLAQTDGWRGQAFSISKSFISSTACQKGIASFCAGLCDEMCWWFNLLRGRIWNPEQLSQIKLPQGLPQRRKLTLAILDPVCPALLLMTFLQWETPGNKTKISKKSLHLFSSFLVHPLPNILFKSSVFH